jgi:hypothetical protein
MRLTTLSMTLLLSLYPSLARAGVSFQLSIGIPAAPPLVAVAPGIQVVEGCPEEVFFSAGWYWCRRPDGWYRARTPRDRFDWIDARRVPAGMLRQPPGAYRNWHRPAAGWRGEGRPGPGRTGGEWTHGRTGY